MPKKAGSYPENWPTSLPYLSNAIIAPPLPKDILSTRALAASCCAIEPNAATIREPQTPYTNIHITPITDPNHPAYRQCGLFTRRGHGPDTFICLYLGLVHDTTADAAAARSDKDVSSPSPHVHSDYDLSLDRDLGLAIDAAAMGNEARFINDYRGIADRPNAEFRDVIVVRGKGGTKERGVGVFVKTAKKDGKKRQGQKGKKEDDVGISKGEEILVSYGRGFWSARRVEASTD
ncbi:hypothetical protein DV736_g6313, partial [Chaetothyriales sp. CBS 134916]